MTFDENNPDVIEIFENENCNKELIQDDAGSSQNKLHDRYKIYSLDECAENIVEGLRAIPRHLNIDKKKKTLDVQPNIKKFLYETFNTAKPQTECQNLCLCSQENIWDSKKENVFNINSGKIYDHCKGHYELYLNYKSEKNSSSWADMMEKNLKWNKQENLDDENQKTTHNIEF